MKKIKQLAIFMAAMFILNIISPNVISFAEVVNNTIVDKQDNSEEFKTDIQAEEVTKEESIILENDKGGEVSKESDTSIVTDNNVSNENVQSKNNDSIISTVDTKSTIISKVENPVMDQKLTEAFKIKGYAVSKDGISKVEIYLDNVKYATATYGIERKDIGSQYPDYPKSNNSGFEYFFKNVSNGKHEIKVSVIDNKGNKSDSIIRVNIDNSKTKIMSVGSLDRVQMINMLRSKNTNLDLKYIVDFVDFTIKEAKIEGVNHDILFAQMMHETGYLKFGGDVKPEQNNFAGIGATGNGNPGNSFPSVEIGIRAVVQHLKAYASTEPLKQAVVDPRFDYVKRGTAIYLEHLGIQENPEGYGWATARGYGYNILNIISELKNQSKTLNFSVLDDVSISGKLSTGSKVTVTATGNPVNDTLYRIWVCNRDTDKWTLLSDWSAMRTADFNPDKAGNYSFVVHAKHKNSTTTSQDHYINKDFKVGVGSSKVTSFNSTGSKFVKSNITLTAKADPEGNSLYRFKIYDVSAKKWTTIQDYSTNNTAVFTPTKVGNYKAYVYVKYKDSSKDSDDSRVIDLAITNPVSKATSLNISGNRYVNETITMTAGADPSGDTLYKLWVCDRSTDTWTVLSDWSTKSTATFVPKKSGNYSFVAHVKHKNSDTKTQDDYKSVDVNINKRTSKATTLNISGSKMVNSNITMTAGAEPAGDTLYKLWVCDRSTDTWTVLSDWSTKNTATFIPKKAGNYSFVAHVKHKNSDTKTQDSYKSVDVNVTSPKSTATGVNVTGTKIVNETLTMTASGTPAGDTLYKLWICDRSTDTWTVLSDWSTKNTATFVPKKSGNYSFVVHVKHKNSDTKTQDSYKSVDVNVTSPKSTATGLSVTGTKIVNETLTMTASGTPAGDTLYKLWVADRSTDTWTVLSDWSTKNTATFVPKKAGNYSFVVHVKHKNSGTTTQDSYKSVDVNVTSPKSTATGLSVTGTKIVNETLTMTASGTPAGDTLYKLWVADRSTDTWTVLSDWSTKNTATFVPKKAGNYSFVVHVKHKNSGTTTQDSYKSVDVKVGSAKSNAKSLSVTGGKYVGSTLTMSATADPADKTLYKLWVADRSTDTWTVLSDWSTKNTATFVPKKAGNYSFVVHVKHKNSDTKTQDSYKSVDVNVQYKKSTVKSLTLSGGNEIGQPITMTATADPSDSTLYKLWVADRSTDTWTVLSDWSTKNTATFTPKKKGNYSFVVHVKNKYSTSNVQEDYMSKDIFAHEKDKATAISLDVTGNYKVNNKISINALAEPQNNALYKIWVCDRVTETWTLLSDWSTNKTASFTPKTSGTYSVVVHVKHKNSKAEKDDYIAKDILVKPDKTLIVIDPGHNYGGDAGAEYKHNGVTYNETILNMEVASKLKRELVSRGYEVVMTREENDRDTLPMRESLAKRVKLANDLNADLFVSIHHNTAPDAPTANGTEVYYSTAAPIAGIAVTDSGKDIGLFPKGNLEIKATNNKISASKKLATDMVNNIASQLGYTNRGAKDEDFYVVKNTLMPSVLVECGFISNPSEAKKLADPNNQLKFAKILADQIQKQF